MNEYNKAGIGMIHQQTNNPVQEKYFTFRIRTTANESEWYYNIETFSFTPSGALIFTEPKSQLQIMTGPATPWIAYQQTELNSRFL